jgi:hypothetical protein
MMYIHNDIDLVYSAMEDNGLDFCFTGVGEEL